MHLWKGWNTDGSRLLGERSSGATQILNLVLQGVCWTLGMGYWQRVKEFVGYIWRGLKVDQKFLTEIRKNMICTSKTTLSMYLFSLKILFSCSSRVSKLCQISDDCHEKWYWSKFFCDNIETFTNNQVFLVMTLWQVHSSLTQLLPQSFPLWDPGNTLCKCLINPPFFLQINWPAHTPSCYSKLK